MSSDFAPTLNLNVQSVRAVDGVYEGDLILSGNNVTLIEGRFDINGSIIVEENATLVLRNALLNFTQTADYQFNITFRNPVNGNPRFVVENSTINTNDFYLRIHFDDNGSADIYMLESYGYYWRINLVARDDSVLNVLNSTLNFVYPGYHATVNLTYCAVYTLHAMSDSYTSISNSEIGILSVREHATVEMLSSHIYSYAYIYAQSVNCSISELEPGLFDYWNFEQNCSVLAAPSGWIPNFTVTNTLVDKWAFYFQGKTNTTISDSLLFLVCAADSSVVSMFAVETSSVQTYGNSILYAYNSSTSSAYLYHNSQVWAINSTCSAPYYYNQACVYGCSYVSVQVLDIASTPVPNANVTAVYSNSTVADSKLTDETGWVKFILIGGISNATGDYSRGNYTIVGTYGYYSANTTVEAYTNPQITLTLDFIIPEFQTVTLTLLFTLATLTSWLLHKKQKKPQ
ncbi:MAG: hypothetical protein QHH24_07830 [Candidatus Bathyarchaeota archaeon]|nr:hypothetical protein [Candidatus Bathyarchaeota archaeon]